MSAGSNIKQITTITKAMRAFIQMVDARNFDIMEDLKLEHEICTTYRDSIFPVALFLV